MFGEQQRIVGCELAGRQGGTREAGREGGRQGGREAGREGGRQEVREGDGVVQPWDGRSWGGLIIFRFFFSSPNIEGKGNVVLFVCIADYYIINDRNAPIFVLLYLKMYFPSTLYLQISNL